MKLQKNSAVQKRILQLLLICKKSFFSIILILGICYGFATHIVSADKVQIDFVKQQMKIIVEDTSRFGVWKDNGQVGKNGFHLYKKFQSNGLQSSSILLHDSLIANDWIEVYYSSAQIAPFAMYCKGEFSALLSKNEVDEYVELAIAISRRYLESGDCSNQENVKRLQRSPNEAPVASTKQHSN